MSPASSSRSFRNAVIAHFCILLMVASASGQSSAKPTAQAQEKTADQANKNIQVFKGMPASNLRNTMFFFRYSLGVTCTHCHIFGQFDQDTKPAKAKAREMIRMVSEINKQHFEGRPEVNCYTCHQGSLSPKNEIPAARLSVESMFTPRTSPGKEEKAAALPSVDDLLARYVDALGGHEALSKITSRIVRGSVISSEGIVAAREINEAALNMVLDVRNSGSEFGDVSEGFDGTTGWRKGNRGISDLHGEQLAEIQMNAQFMPALRIKELYSKLIVMGQEKFDAEPVYVMTGLSTLTGKRERLSFGVQSGLLLRRSVVTENYVGSIVTDTYYEAYRKINGINTPMLISEYTPDSGSIMKVSRVEYNAAVDPAKFKKPVK
jgi:hypothetical protein